MNASAARGTPGYLCQLSAAVLVCLSVPELATAQAGAAEPTEEIIVTSSIIAQPRRQIGTAVSAIDFEEIELRGYTDLSDVLRTQTPRDFVWGAAGFPERYSGADVIVYGHKACTEVDEDGWPRLRIHGRTFGIDTIGQGVLTALRLPDLHVWRSGAVRASASGAPGESHDPCNR